MNTAPVTLARHAMATRFEIVLFGDDPVRLRAAGEEALEEIEHLEARLSLFRPSSEIAHVNALAAREPVRVTPPVFALLAHARQLHEESAGAFDITVAPLVRCWGFMGEGGKIPSPEALAEARARTGMHLVELDPKASTVRFAREGVMIDLGAIGKGYAIECSAEILREAGVTRALLHGGTSTVYAIGRPPGEEPWKVAVELPGPPPDTGLLPPPLATVPLCDEAMSVSAVWGKFFESGGRTYGHVLDPRTGCPASHAVLSAVVLPSATETDALSTALLTLGPAGLDAITGLRPQMRALVAREDQGRYQVQSRGLEVQAPPGPDPAVSD